jgi:hypothetical protein
MRQEPAGSLQKALLSLVAAAYSAPRHPLISLSSFAIHRSLLPPFTVFQNIAHE